MAPADIAIAAASPAEYDDHFLALRAEANLDLHFVHGVRTVTTREGQAAAALADHRRAWDLPYSAGCGASPSCARKPRPLLNCPDGWLRVLPPDAPLTDTSTPGIARLRVLKPEDWPDGVDHNAAARAAVLLLVQGPTAAEQLGEAFLEGRALTIWRKALAAGPATAIDLTLANLKQDDGLEACVSVAWMPAAELAACPRPNVRLVGMNSGRWPRGHLRGSADSGSHHPHEPDRPAAGEPRRPTRLPDYPRHEYQAGRALMRAARRGRTPA